MLIQYFVPINAYFRSNFPKTKKRGLLPPKKGGLEHEIFVDFFSMKYHTEIYQFTNFQLSRIFLEVPLMAIRIFPGLFEFEISI